MKNTYTYTLTMLDHRHEEQRHEKQPTDNLFITLLLLKCVGIDDDVALRAVQASTSR